MGVAGLGVVIGNIGVVVAVSVTGFAACPPQSVVQHLVEETHFGVICLGEVSHLGVSGRAS